MWVYAESMSDQPVTLWENETEGWPYDGSQSLLVWSPEDGFAIERTRRHIDADSERWERTALSNKEALEHLRDAGCYLGVLARHIAPLLETAVVISADEEGELLELDGVRLRRSWVAPEAPSLLEQLSHKLRGTEPDSEPVALWSWASV